MKWYRYGYGNTISAKRCMHRMQFHACMCIQKSTLSVCACVCVWACYLHREEHLGYGRLTHYELEALRGLLRIMWGRMFVIIIGMASLCVM
ncbi:hypothetical protein EON63_20780 [archaeon]|nr:MAG: hypothetical protein EON63_20780 [archaeon]